MGCEHFSVTNLYLQSRYFRCKNNFPFRWGTKKTSMWVAARSFIEFQTGIVKNKGVARCLDTSVFYCPFWLVLCCIEISLEPVQNKPKKNNPILKSKHFQVFFLDNDLVNPRLDNCLLNPSLDNCLLNPRLNNCLLNPSFTNCLFNPISNNCWVNPSYMYLHDFHFWTGKP